MPINISHQKTTRVTERGGNTNIAMTDDERREQREKQQRRSSSSSSGTKTTSPTPKPAPTPALQPTLQPTPSPATTGLAGAAPTPTSATAAIEGLSAAAPQQATVSGGAGGPVDLPAVGALRQGLGTRIYPQASMALAGLKKVY